MQETSGTATSVGNVPTSYQRRERPCSHCGNVVLVVEASMGTIFGARIGRKPRMGLQHADPGPDGEVFDAVDDGCRRAPMR